MLKKIIRRLIGPPKEKEVQWVVNELGELGVRIDGRSFFMWRGESLVYESEPDSPKQQRLIGKWEFGERCRPLHLPLGQEHYTKGEGWFPLNTH